MSVVADPEAIARLTEDAGASIYNPSLNQTGLTTELDAEPSASTPTILSTHVEVMLIVLIFIAHSNHLFCPTGPSYF